MREFCCVAGCENDLTKSHRIPADPDRRKTWLNAMRLENPKPSSRICHLHFTTQDYLKTNQLDQDPQRRYLRPSAIPSIFPWNWNKRKNITDDVSINITASSVNGLNNNESTMLTRKKFKVDTVDVASKSSDEMVVNNEIHSNSDTAGVAQSSDKKIAYNEISSNCGTTILLAGDDSSCDSKEENADETFSYSIDIDDLGNECVIDNNIDSSDDCLNLNEATNTVEKCTVRSSINKTHNLKSDSKNLNSRSSFHGIKLNFSLETLEGSDKAIHMYTGLETYDKFKFVFSTLGQAAYELKYFYRSKPPINVLNQFFLTLIILRQHKSHSELSLLFNIQEKQVANIFITWIKFMSLQWREICQWPSRELVQFYTPIDFKRKFPGTRLIVDGTEIPINKPGIPTSQQHSYSTYKNKSTVKTLIGITPGGLTSYVSTAYAGSTSDRQVIERSDVIKKCDPGDRIMSDKGFDIQDLLAPYGIILNIPTHFKRRNQIACTTLIKDQKIASKRVHVERIIGLGKSYNILNGKLNNCEIKLSDDIIFICFMLCNFRRTIIDQNK